MRKYSVAGSPRSRLIAALLLGIPLLLSACATPGVGGGDYNRRQVRGEQSVRLGVVESVRAVRIDDRASGLGTLAGVATGAVAGGAMGSGRGNGAAAVVGAVVGGIAGNAIEQSASRREGVEVTIRLDSNRIIAVTQEADEAFKPGDRVQVLGGGGAVRVTHLAAGSTLSQVGIAEPSSAIPPPPGSAPGYGSVPPPGSAPGYGAPATPPGQTPPGVAPEARADTRFFCPDSKAYFPDVQNCNSHWMRVLP